MYRFTCPTCKTVSDVDAAAPGSNFRCRACHALLPLPNRLAPTSANFLTDLAHFYHDVGFKKPKEPEEYFPDLATTIERIRRERAERASRFRVDLTDIYHGISPPCFKEHLTELAALFTNWREKSNLEMKKYYAWLPADDPLYCPISLFGAMKYGRLEVAHTTVLAWLLNPKEHHGFGDSLFRALLGKHVPGFVMPMSIDVEKVRSEHPIENGRLDVFAEGTFERYDGSSEKWLLVAEAKIDAEEGESQLLKYDKWIDNHALGREVFRVFLTTDGRPPDTSEESWVPVSFLQLACTFRSAIKTLRDQPGYHFLRFYLAGLLKDVCRWSLPLRVQESCNDPYSYIDYLRVVQASEDSHNDRSG